MIMLTSFCSLHVNLLNGGAEHEAGIIGDTCTGQYLPSFLCFIRIAYLLIYFAKHTSKPVWSGKLFP